jgi:hypothetical protein
MRAGWFGASEAVVLSAVIAIGLFVWLASRDAS